MTYAQFALAWSFVVIVMWLGLIAIAVRRASFRDRRATTRTESVAVHARYFEGPIISFGLFMAVLTGAAAFLIGTNDYARLAALIIATARGFLLALGVGLLAFYWRQRATWL